MADDTKKALQTQLWNIANTLRGKMGADEFRDYILGFIFYKYLSERMHLFADDILKHDGIIFDQIDESTQEGLAMLADISAESVDRLGYFLGSTLRATGSRPGPQRRRADRTARAQHRGGDRACRPGH